MRPVRKLTILGNFLNKDSSIQLRSGNSIPVLGLGTWQLTHDTGGTVAYALELGYPLIDTSSDYGTHPGIATALSNSNIARGDIYVVTKVEETDDPYARAKSNLSELGIEYIDLLLIHRPPPASAGEWLWQGLIRARNEGLARDIGVSNYSTGLIDKLIAASGEIPAVNQIEWSPFGHSEAMKKYCEDKSIIIQAYSPLSRTKRLDDEKVVQIARKYQKSTAQILIRWNLQQGSVPIPKANQLRHLEENIDVFDFEIDKSDIQLLDNLNEGYSALGYLPYT